jgi:hypothetical protein
MATEFWGAVWPQLIASVIWGAASVFILFWCKLPQTLTRLTENVEHLGKSLGVLNESVESLEKRMQVTDRIFSDILARPIDTDIISKDGTKYPPGMHRKHVKREQ